MTQALQTLLAHAERQRDTAMAALRQSEEQLRGLQRQAAQLSLYRDEYRQRHPARGGRAAPIDLLRSHDSFMQRLDQALQQSLGQRQAAEARAALLRSALVGQEIRVASVRKLLERRGLQTRSDQQRLEQRRADDAQPRRRDDGGGAPGWRLGTEAMPLTP